MPDRRKGNPSSIRWKWGFRLTLAFLLFFFSLSVPLLNGFQERLYQERKEDAEQLIHAVSETFGQLDTRMTKNNVESLMEKISVSTTTRGMLRVTNLPLLEQLREEGVVVRIFDADAQLLYESTPNNTSFQRTSGYYFQETRINNREAFIGAFYVLLTCNRILLSF